MNEIMPQTVEDFVRNLRKLRVQRNDAQKQAQRVPRKALTAEERMAILSKTGGRCHICGGEIVPNSSWDADHVQRHGVGGGNKSDNYLAAHELCNTYRWDHLPEEMQWVLKIGVWARRQMESNSEFGRKMTNLFFERTYEPSGRDVHLRQQRDYADQDRLDRDASERVEPARLLKRLPTGSYV